MLNKIYILTIVTVLCLIIYYLFFCNKSSKEVVNINNYNSIDNKTNNQYSNKTNNEENSNKNNNSVFNIDGSVTDYPKKYTSYFDQNKYYPELNIVNENHDIIIRELEDVKNKDPKLWHVWIENQLSVIPLYFFGKWSSKGKELFPETCEIIKNISRIKTVAFSRLKANSQIQPHIGWGDLANDILRCHYGLEVPEKCGCVCDNWVVLHENNKWLVFDDAKMHSSYNYSDKDRIILIIDMERPKEVPKGKSKVAYKKEVLEFINSFYDQEDINSIKNELNL
jgi:beta-hydroxylase